MVKTSGAIIYGNIFLRYCTTWSRTIKRLYCYHISFKEVMHCKFHIRERAFQFLLEPISGLTNTLDIGLVFTTNGIIWNQKQLKLFQHLKKKLIHMYVNGVSPNGVIVIVNIKHSQTNQ